MRRFVNRLVLCAVVTCASGPSLAQVTPPPPKEQLSADEQVLLDRLRNNGEAVFSISNRACVRELDRISNERRASKGQSPTLDASSMKAFYETDMFFASARLAVIEQHCGKAANLGDYQQTERFLEKTSGTCRMLFSTCGARRHF